MKRRHFLGSIPLSAGLFSGNQPADSEKSTAYKLKLSCNLYSFNQPLRSGEMSLEEVIDYCADLGFDAVDPTGYYFNGYPAAPPPAYIYSIKKRAFLQGLDISGTGVRNDFTVPDINQRKRMKRSSKNGFTLQQTWMRPCFGCSQVEKNRRRPTTSR